MFASPFLIFFFSTYISPTQHASCLSSAPCCHLQTFFLLPYVIFVIILKKRTYREHHLQQNEVSKVCQRHQSWRSDNVSRILPYFVLWKRRSLNLNAMRCSRNICFGIWCTWIYTLWRFSVCCGGAAQTLALLCCSNCWQWRQVCTIDSSHWIGCANFSTLSLHPVMIYTF